MKNKTKIIARKSITAILFAAIMIVSVFTVNAVTAQNLLTNPGAEDGDMSGWTIIANGGDGWGIWGVDTTDYAGPYEGNHCFLTSYEWCNRSQEVDLLAKGYTEAQLDTAPTVCAKEWFGQANTYCKGKYYLKVELRDEYHNAIASWDSGEHLTTWGGSGSASWYQLTHDFSDYGPGLRYIYWEDGGKDEEWWKGYYGAKLDTASLIVDTIPPEISVTVSQDTLWPPNHKMVDITATVTVSDNCDLNPSVVLTSVTSNEPDDAKGSGDGKTVNDIQGVEIGTEDYEFQLRAERAGKGDGRIYTITYTATDESGNSASASATVVVPHDMG